MDKESLPTGIDKPSSWHHWLTACTVSYKAASWPSPPHAAIQLAENLISRKSRTSVEMRLVGASATAKRAAAGGLYRATGLRSHMAYASPRTASNSSKVIA